MENLIRDTLRKIRERHIRPEPRWKYLVKKYGLWLLFAAVVSLAAIFSSAAYDNAYQLDWDLYLFMSQNRFIYFLSIIPYFWVALIAIFLIAAFFEIRKTETGYRFSWPKVLLMTFGSIFAVGIFVSVLGFGGRLNSVMSKNFPSYGRHMMTTKESQWMQPDKGFLAGTIVSESGNELSIKDLDEKDWNILLDEETSVKPSVDIEQGEKIKIIGERKDSNNFKAEEIRPWEGKGMMNGGSGRGTGNGNGNR